MWNDQYMLESIQAPRMSSSPPNPWHTADDFHIVHKVPVGDTPYVRAKHVQLVEKDPERAISLFWASINAGDRVDSALKDMAIVMKQQNRPEEAIEAIKSLRDRCSDQTQEALDNVLLDLYKRCGRIDEQVSLLKRKLNLIHQGLAFNGKRTKTARSQGKKFQVSIEQEASRLLGNLGWAYMQLANYVAAEAVYRKALSIEPDNNKVCNLGICLMKQGRLQEAKAALQSVTCPDRQWGTNSHHKSYERAQEMLDELEAMESGKAREEFDVGSQSDCWNPFSSSARTVLRGHIQHMLAATSGFGPLQQLDTSSDHGQLRICAEQTLETDDEDYEKNVRSTRKRIQPPAIDQPPPADMNQYWPPLSTSTSPYCQQVDDSVQLNSSTLESMPLTSDWTNKAYGRSPASVGDLRWGKARRSVASTTIWKDLPDENIPTARRSLCFNNTSEASSGNPLRDEENVKWENLGFAHDPETLLDFCAGRGESGDSSEEEARHQPENVGSELRSQRRLKVFEEMTLPARPQIK